MQKCLSEVIALHEFCSLIEHEHPNKGFSLDSMDDLEFLVSIAWNLGLVL